MKKLKKLFYSSNRFRVLIYNFDGKLVILEMKINNESTNMKKK